MNSSLMSSPRWSSSSCDAGQCGSNRGWTGRQRRTERKLADVAAPVVVQQLRLGWRKAERFRPDAAAKALSSAPVISLSGAPAAASSTKYCRCISGAGSLARLALPQPGKAAAARDGMPTANRQAPAKCGAAARRAGPASPSACTLAHASIWSAAITQRRLQARIAGPRVRRRLAAAALGPHLAAAGVHNLVHVHIVDAALEKVDVLAARYELLHFFPAPHPLLVCLLRGLHAALGHVCCKPLPQGAVCSGGCWCARSLGGRATRALGRGGKDLESKVECLHGDRSWLAPLQLAMPPPAAPPPQHSRTARLGRGATGGRRTACADRSTCNA